MRCTATAVLSEQWRPSIDPISISTFNASYSTLMTQYISSFLIEPIVEQARRFSQSSNPSRPDPRDLSQASHSSASAHDEGYNSADVAVEGAVQLPQTTSPIVLDDTAVSPIFEEINDDDIGPEHTTEVDAAEPSTTGFDPLLIDEESLDHPSQSIRHHIHSLSGSTDSSVGSIANNISRRGATMPPLRTATGRFNARHSAHGSTRRTMDSQIPADDGMRDLRSRILAIQSSSSTHGEKARLVHSLMTQTYTSSRTVLQDTLSHDRSRSPHSMYSSERPSTPLSAPSIDSAPTCSSQPKASPSSFSVPTTISVSPEDRLPTYCQKPKPSKGPAAGDRAIHTGGNSSISLSSEADTANTSSTPTLGCPHYKRNIKLQCSTCSKWYTCRFCHDEIEDHPLVRKDTKNMLCMLCGHAQIAGEHCTECGERAAWYYCDVCKLWDDDMDKSIYHCDECGICRVGKGLGKDFHHCKVRLSDLYSSTIN